MKKILKQIENDLFRIFAKWYFGLMVTSLFIMTGCGTIIGGLIGASVSREHQEFNYKSELDHLQLSRLGNDTKLSINLKDSSIVEGSFKGLLFSTKIKLLPSIIDTISLTISSSDLNESKTKLKYLYAGIDSQHVFVVAKPKSALIKMPISMISKLEDNSGNEYNLKTIKEIMVSGTLPNDTHLMMSVENNILQLQITEINKIIVKTKPKNFKLTGALIIGMGIDIFILIYGLSNIIDFVP